jgi:vacuolar protein sorting-associated protein IST1
LKEGICSLIFAAPRCSELPELGRIRDIFEKKYGKDFVSAAVDLRPDAAVNNLVSMDESLVRTQQIIEIDVFAYVHYSQI